MREEGGAASGPTDLSARAYRWLLVAATLGGFWLTRRGFTARVPAGADVMAHVARTDAALHLFRHGRLDGWFPTFGSGYRLFAVYGPGLAMASGMLRVASLGVVHSARALAILGATSIALLPVTMAILSREIGLSRRASVLAGTATLLVSMPNGGGLAGLYGHGLVAQSVAMPALLLVLAGLVRIARTGSVGATAATAIGVAWLIVLHPISLAVGLIMTPGLLLAVPRPWVPRHLLRAVGAAAWGAAISAVWMIPAFRDRALRGGLSAFPTPTFTARVGDVAGGEMLYPRALSLAVAIGLAMALGAATRSRAARRWLAPPLWGVLVIAIGHAAVGRDWPPVELWVQVPNRGLALVGYLLLLPLAAIVADAIGRLRPRPAIGATTAIVVGLIAITPIALRSHALSPPQVAPPATEDLQATARLIKRIVPPSARHLLVQPSPFVPLGTSEPSRWLASVTGRNTAQLYFTEATRNPGAGDLPGTALEARSPDEALGPLRRAGITHVVATTPVPAEQLVGQIGYRRVATYGNLSVWAVEPDPSAPAVRDLLQPDAEALRSPDALLTADLLHASAEDLRWSVDARPGGSAAGRVPTVVVAPVAYDPGWVATVDGRRVPVSASSEGLARFTVPDGRHRVELRFTGSRNHLPGLLISTIALVAAVVTIVRATIRFRVR